MPFLLVFGQAWLDPTFGAGPQSGVSPTKIKRWRYSKRVRYTFWRAWQLSQAGPVFRFGAFVWRWVARGLRAALGDRLDGTPVKPTKLVVSPRLAGAGVRWNLVQSSILSQDRAVVETAQQLGLDPGAELAWTEAYAGAADSCDVELKLPWRACQVRVCSENTRGRSDWVIVKPFYCLQSPVDGTGGLGPHGTYSWKQSDVELELTVPLPALAAPAKEFSVTIKKTALRVAHGPTGTSFVDGKLRNVVEPEDSFWEMSGKGDDRRLVVTLCKKEPGGTWPCVVVGHPLIDVGELRAKERELKQAEQDRENFMEQVRNMPPEAAPEPEAGPAVDVNSAAAEAAEAAEAADPAKVEEVSE